MVERAIRFLVGLMLALVLLFFALAYGLYFLGARHVPERWEPTATTYPASIRNAWWQIDVGSEPVAIEPLSPPSLLVRWLVTSHHIGVPRRAEDAQMHALWQAARLGLVDSQTRHRHLAGWTMMVRASQWPDGRVVDTVLDRSYFGGDARGLHAGAQRVFARPLASLDEVEVNLLIALMRGPGYLDPWCHRDRLRERVAATTAATPAQLAAAFAHIAPKPVDASCR